MAGLFLRSGNCGFLFKYVELAQEHTELICHLKFPESMEAIINIVCTSCDKHCQSKTGTEFVDKTSEAAKPIEPSASAHPEEGTEAGETVKVFSLKVPANAKVEASKSNPSHTPKEMNKN